jgi:hypothetical protein
MNKSENVINCYNTINNNVWVCNYQYESISILLIGLISILLLLMYNMKINKQ